MISMKQVTKVYPNGVRALAGLTLFFGPWWVVMLLAIGLFPMTRVAWAMLAAAADAASARRDDQPYLAFVRERIRNLDDERRARFRGD